MMDVADVNFDENVDEYGGIIAPKEPMVLPMISAEQQAIVDAIGTNNVIVDSVAGSGKTTTALYIAKKYPDTEILLLTYNSKLRMETFEKASDLKLTNITVHTYHSFGFEHIDKSCRTDAGIIKFLHSDRNLDYLSYGIVLIDECQDMTSLYCRLVIKILNTIGALDVAAYPRLCIIGDKWQSIYGYAGADARFITMADVIYHTRCDIVNTPNDISNKTVNTYALDTWKRLTLSTSYRLTMPMTLFINKCVLGEDRLVAVKIGRIPSYTVCNSFIPTNAINEVCILLQSGYKPDDIFILAASVKSNKKSSPIKKLANALTKNKIPIYLPSNDDARPDEDIMRGKIVFSSFHQAKGLERKAVLVMGFDNSYFTYYNHDDAHNVCSNALYVALTRSSEYLSVYHDKANPPLRFIDLKRVSMCTDMRGALPTRLRAKKDNAKPQISLGVTALVEHLSSETITQCIALMDCSEIRPPGDLLNIPIKSEQIDVYGIVYNEEVSDINGVAIPSYYEYMTSGKMTIAGNDAPNLTIKQNALDTIDTAQLLEITNKYLAKRSGLMFKLQQIFKYDWLTSEMLQMSCDRLALELSCDDYDDIVPNQPQKITMELETKCTIMGVEIVGMIDVITTGRIIEVKTVSELKPEHFIQLAIYAYCWETSGKPSMTYQIYNVRTNELTEFVYNEADTKLMLEILVCKKYHPSVKLSDEQFLADLGIGGEPVVRDCAECAKWRV